MIYFLIPVYNEEANVSLLASNLKASVKESCFFVFSDDGSTDCSKKLIEKHFDGEKFIILGDGTNHGPGYAFNTGFEWILKHSTSSDDLVVTLEADNTSDISILTIMLAISGLGYDLVLASPYAQGGGFSNTSWVRKILSFIANMIFRLIFDIKVLTLSSFYRTYRLSLLQSIKNKYGKCIEQAGFLCMLEILVKAINSKAKIIEVPMMLHSDRRSGKSKMKLIGTSIAYLRFLLTSKNF